jgi:hypothetical protein
MLQRAHIFLNIGFTESTTEKHEKNQTHALQTRASWGYFKRILNVSFLCRLIHKNLLLLLLLYKLILAEES